MTLSMFLLLHVYLSEYGPPAEFLITTKEFHSCYYTDSDSTGGQEKSVMEDTVKSSHILAIVDINAHHENRM